MSIFKTVLIIALVAAVASAKPKGRSSGHHGQGRAAAVAAAAKTPDNKDAHAEVKDALKEATEHKEVLEKSEKISAPEAASASAALQDTLKDAIAAAADSPHAQAVQPEVVAAKVEDTKADLDHHIEEAKAINKDLKKNGPDMKPVEAAAAHKDLQEHLDLALHAAEQNDKAVQQEKAIESGAHPAEVAAIPAAVSTGAAPVAVKGRRG